MWVLFGVVGNVSRSASDRVHFKLISHPGAVSGQPPKVPKRVSINFPPPPEVWQRCGGCSAEARRRCGRGAAKVWQRCGGGAAEVRRRCGRGCGTVPGSFLEMQEVIFEHQEATGSSGSPGEAQCGPVHGRKGPVATPGAPQRGSMWPRTSLQGSRASASWASERFNVARASLQGSRAMIWGLKGGHSRGAVRPARGAKGAGLRVVLL